jgi:hypothetical protein
MDELSAAPPTGTAAGRRTEDIALDLMKFIAMTTGYGRPQSGAGFSGKPAGQSADDYAGSLLLLYERCRGAVEKK